MTAPTRPRRRWFQFGLRTMFVVVIVVAIPLAWVAKERRQSAHEQRLARHLHASVCTLGGPYDSYMLLMVNRPQGWWRDGFRYLLGMRIAAIAFDSEDRDGLEQLTGLTNLQWLGFGSSKVDDCSVLAEFKRLRGLRLSLKQLTDLTPLAGLTELEVLDLNATSVADISPLSGLPRIKELRLKETHVDDLTPLSGLQTLRYLDLEKTPVTELTPLTGLKELLSLNLVGAQVDSEQIGMFRKAFPYCKIKHDPFP